MNIDMGWQTVQHMTHKERKDFKNKIIAINREDTDFITYAAKYYLATLVHHSECYFNSSGTSTRVKEFEELGWYDAIGLNFSYVNK